MNTYDRQIPPVEPQLIEAERADRILESPVHIILEACGMYPPRNNDVTREDFVRYRDKGDLDAKERLVLHNLGLVVMGAKDVRQQNNLHPQEMPDLIQRGVPGLIRAVELYDVNYADEDGRKAQFSTYAQYWIRQSITRAVANESDLVRIPVHVRDKHKTHQRTFAFLREQLGRDPTHKEVADELGTTTEAIKSLHYSTLQPVSLDRYIGKDEDGESEWLQLYDVENPAWVKDEEAVEVSELAANLRDLMKEVLDDRERMIVDAYYGLTDDTPQTLDAIGPKFNITRERVRQILGNAMHKMTEEVKRRDRQDQFDAVAPSRAERRAPHGKVSPQAFPATMIDYVALDVRAYTRDREKRRAVLAEARAARVDFEKKAAKIDAQYETSLKDRATGSMHHAIAGRILTRQEYFERYSNVNPAKLDIQDRDAPRWASFFANQFGMYGYHTMRPLWDAMKALNRPATITELQNIAEVESDHLFDIHSEFLASLLAIASEQRLVAISRTGDDTQSVIRYAAGVDSPYHLREVRAFTPRSPVELPKSAQQVFRIMKLLSAGDGPDTAITFSQLRNAWADTVSTDVNEVQLRRGLEYLKRSGYIGSGKSKNRINLLWHTGQPLGRRAPARLKPHELWYEDKD